MRVATHLRSLRCFAFWLLVPALVLGSTAAAQSVVSAEPPSLAVAGDPEPTVVLLTLEGRLLAEAADASLPAELVDRIAAEPALARMDVDNRAGSGAHPTVSVNFVFQSTAAYRAWYDSAPTRALLRDLAAAIGDPRRHLRIQRRGSSGWFGS